MLSQNPVRTHSNTFHTMVLFVPRPTSRRSVRHYVSCYSACALDTSVTSVVTLKQRESTRPPLCYTYDMNHVRDGGNKLDSRRKKRSDHIHSSFISHAIWMFWSQHQFYIACVYPHLCMQHNACIRLLVYDMCIYNVYLMAIYGLYRFPCPQLLV